MKRYLWLLLLVTGLWLFAAGMMLDREHYDWLFGFSGLFCIAAAVLILLFRLIRWILSRVPVDPSAVKHGAEEAGGAILKVLAVLIKAVGYFLAGAFAIAFFPLVLIYAFSRNRHLTKGELRGSSSERGQAYERACARRLEKQGYRNVSFTPTTGDFGADLIAYDRKGRKVCFQCKCYFGNVGEAAVQEVISAVHYYGASYGIVMTNADFTPKARELARAAGVGLWPHIDANLDWIDRIEELHAFLDD